MGNATDNFTLIVYAIGQMATLTVEAEYKEQTASALGAYETHFLYTVGDPPATADFGAEWSASGSDNRTPISHFEPQSPVTGIAANAINTGVVSGLLPQNTQDTWTCTIVMDQPDGP